jgi:murein peptide amidase A
MRRRRVLTGALVGIAAGLALIALAHSLSGASARSAGPVESPPPTRDEPPVFSQAVRTPGSRVGVVGRSTEGRPIVLREYGRPAIEGELLVFGCVHGDECAGRILRPLTQITSFCPDPSSDVYVVPNLNPDGHALGTRLNGRGVDLNRNFPAGWQPIGSRGDPEHSGPRPFSEPETRLAARIVRRLRPEVTIWFHQHHAPRPLVRAWGRSVAAARRYARLARLPFRRMPWPAGTAPHWQNRHLAEGSSFVVEMPRGPLAEGRRALLERALVRLGRSIARVGED